MRQAVLWHAHRQWVRPVPSIQWPSHRQASSSLVGSINELPKTPSRLANGSHPRAQSKFYNWNVIIIFSLRKAAFSAVAVFLFKMVLGLWLNVKTANRGRGRLRDKYEACAEIALETFFHNCVLLNLVDGPNFQTSLKREISFQLRASRAIPIIFCCLAARRI